MDEEEKFLFGLNGYLVVEDMLRQDEVQGERAQTADIFGPPYLLTSDLISHARSTTASGPTSLFSGVAGCYSFGSGQRWVDSPRRGRSVLLPLV